MEDEGGRYSIGDSGEVRSRRKMKHGDIDHGRPPSVWLAATSMASIDPRKIVGVCGALSALMKEWPQVRAIVNLHDGPSDGEPRGDPRRGIKLAEEFTLDNRITTTWITAPKVRFWMVLHPSTALMKNLHCHPPDPQSGWDAQLCAESNGGADRFCGGCRQCP